MFVLDRARKNVLGAALVRISGKFSFWRVPRFVGVLVLLGVGVVVINTKMNNKSK